MEEAPSFRAFSTFPVQIMDVVYSIFEGSRHSNFHFWDSKHRTTSHRRHNCMKVSSLEISSFRKHIKLEVLSAYQMSRYTSQSDELGRGTNQLFSFATTHPRVESVLSWIPYFIIGEVSKQHADWFLSSACSLLQKWNVGMLLGNLIFTYGVLVTYWIWRNMLNRVASSLSTFFDIISFSPRFLKLGYVVHTDFRTCLFFLLHLYLFLNDVIHLRIIL